MRFPIATVRPLLPNKITLRPLPNRSLRWDEVLVHGNYGPGGSTLVEASDEGQRHIEYYEMLRRERVAAQADLAFLIDDLREKVLTDD